MARVLVVEDEAVMAKAVTTGLRRAGHVVDVAVDGHAALERTGIISYDLVLLDRDLPFVHGDDVCRAMVARGDPARILMLTAARTITSPSRSRSTSCSRASTRCCAGRRPGPCR